jgi:hypothetical protein
MVLSKSFYILYCCFLTNGSAYLINATSLSSAVERCGVSYTTIHWQLPGHWIKKSQVYDLLSLFRTWVFKIIWINDALARSGSAVIRTLHVAETLLFASTGSTYSSSCCDKTGLSSCDRPAVDDLVFNFDNLESTASHVHLGWRFLLYNSNHLACSIVPQTTMKAFSLYFLFLCFTIVLASI